ncbi:hypothetical protein [Metabacillus hrfriensis]|uniref:Uncharacterized protein n=1 Tax=Metabacillus hrfriensis TaxID=3048891 RepID=A0ACD4RIR8_9BACI|nr:hypothetical protein [Metabacillus sp. CT-WN-B3]WHZ60382.1 hypothetical protein QLQ22_06975 [Metabacillus sp. CT-WN-B3]
MPKIMKSHFLKGVSLHYSLPKLTKQKKESRECHLNWRKGGSHVHALSGGLSPSMKAEYEKWLDARGWYYEEVME